LWWITLNDCKKYLSKSTAIVWEFMLNKKFLKLQFISFYLNWWRKRKKKRELEGKTARNRHFLWVQVVLLTCHSRPSYHSASSSSSSPSSSGFSTLHHFASQFLHAIHFPLPLNIWTISFSVNILSFSLMGIC